MKSGCVYKPRGFTFPVMSSAAKTVSFSPLRRGQQSIKNTLDSPFKLKWPDVSSQNASQILAELEESLSELKGCFARSKEPKKRSRKRRQKSSAAPKSGSEPQEPARKKACLESSLEGTLNDPDSDSNTCKTDILSTTDPSNTPTESSTAEDAVDNSTSSILAASNTDTGKVGAADKSSSSDPNIVDVSNKCTSSLDAVSIMRSQMVVGVNNVTRCLERGELSAGLVCLSAKPALVTRHILMLAAIQHIPFAAIHNLSERIVTLLGDIKSALAIGFKKGIRFANLTETITKLAPPIVLPWLPALKESTSDPHKTFADPQLSTTPTNTKATHQKTEKATKKDDTQTVAEESVGDKNSAGPKEHSTTPKGDGKQLKDGQKTEAPSSSISYVPVQIKKTVVNKRK